MEVIGKDLYLRQTSTDGKFNIQCHRVWDKARAFNSIRENYSEADPPIKVTIATREEYKEFMGYK